MSPCGPIPGAGLLTMDDFPLSRHAVFRSASLDETRQELAQILGAQSLEFATSDQRLDARVHAVALPHVLAASVSFGSDVVGVLDPVDDCFLVDVPMSGSMQVRGRRCQF